MLYQLFSSILNMALISCPVIITVLFVRGIMYALPKKYRYFIWCIVGIRLTCPFAISSPASLFNLIGTDLNNIVTIEDDINKTVSSQTISNQTDKNDYYGVTGNSVWNNVLKDNKMPSGFQDNANIQKENKFSGNISSHGSSIKNTGADKKQASPFIKYGAFIWIAGIIFILSWNFYKVFCMKKHLERAVWFKDNIYECENIPSPFVMGIFRPRIYIPFRLGKEEQKYILEHEKYHIMRRDYIIKPVSFLIACIYWFNPLVWVSYFLMVRDMEMSCDEYVLQSLGVNIRKDYSMSLLGFATNQRVKNAGLLSFGETDTRKRVVNVLNFKEHGKWIGVLAAALILIAGAACLTNAYDSDKKIVKKNESENKTGNKIVQNKNNGNENEEKGKTENGIKKQASSVAVEADVNNTENNINPDGAGNSFYFKNTGVTIGLPENKNWIQNPVAYENGNTGTLQYYDGIAETGVTLGFGKKSQKEITGLSEESSYKKEYWSFFPGEYEKLIEVQFYKIKNNKTVVLLLWEYNKINFYMRADFATNKNSNTEWTSLAKTAAYIAENWYNVLNATDNYIFSNKDIKTAKTAVKNYFKKAFKDCTIKKLWFDKDAYQRNVTYYSNLYGKDDMIILYSDFYVSKDCKDNSLEKDGTYTNFMWIMSRNKKGEWKVETYGY